MGEVLNKLKLNTIVYVRDSEFSTKDIVNLSPTKGTHLVCF